MASVETVSPWLQNATVIAIGASEATNPKEGLKTAGAVKVFANVNNGLQ